MNQLVLKYKKHICIARFRRIGLPVSLRMFVYMGSRSFSRRADAPKARAIFHCFVYFNSWWVKTPTADPDYCVIILNKQRIRNIYGDTDFNNILILLTLFWYFMIFSVYFETLFETQVFEHSFCCLCGCYDVENISIKNVICLDLDCCHRTR